MSEVGSTGRNSHVPGNSFGPQFGRAPPRTPLPPHRLAKIANALGISTPSPAGSNSSTFVSPAFPGGSPSTSNTDLRIATPSNASAHSIGSPSQTKFFLHVIPPHHLSHDFDTPDLAPPPPTASGYHTQFRRGTLVALQPSMHAQLVAIAKEYALPSTVGLILYLVTASPQSRQSSPMPFANPASGNEDAEEPGPRLSEDIWRHIWARVLKIEREETFALSRGPTPSPFGMGLGSDPSGHPNLRPLITPTRAEQPFTYPITPSSTASSVSDLRSHSKSTPLSSSHSEPDTPDTSRSSDNEALGIDLPGLNSLSIIPILAKVEFDIDRRRAAWYEPWLRGRRMTFARRAESRQSNRACSRSQSRAEGDVDEKRAPFDLKLVERMQNAGSVLSFTASSSSKEKSATGGYAPLSDSADEAVETEDDEAKRVTDDDRHHDPLADVFGTDADTWADMRVEAESQGSQREVNPNVVELALDASSLVAFPDQELLEDEVDEVDDAEEVQDIMRRMSKSPLVVSIPSIPDSKSSPTMTSAKRSIPPPLVLAPQEPNKDLVLHPESSSMVSLSSEGDSTYLPYATRKGMPVDNDGHSLEMEQEYMRSRSPAEEKRVGAVFEDLNLGLDLGGEEEEYDENDPNDRRRSQYLMRAKLDEIERTLAQFSPRQLKTSDLDDDLTITHTRSKSLLARVPSKLSVDQTSDIHARGNSNDHNNASEKSWPAIPYSSIANMSQPSSALSPQIAVNGVSTSAPKSFVPSSRSASPNSVSAETKMRKRDLEPSTYPPPLPPSYGKQSDIADDSPIPLSPDPFGRYASYHESESQSMPTYWDPATGQFTSIPIESRPSLSSVDEGSLASTTPSSRFSADSFSMDATAKPSAPLVSVKTFKRFWRRSKSSSVSGQQPPTPSAGRTSFQVSASPVLSSQDQSLPPPPPQRGLPPVPIATPSRPSRPISPSAPHSSEKTGVRKSILKTWKSVSGATASSSATSEPRRDTERPVSNETIKPRRSSILDAGIPPTPKLAEQYLPSNHARTGSGIFERRKSLGRAKMGPSANSSTSSQDVAVPSSSATQPPGSVSPARSEQSAASRYSQVDGSFETAQYELISPPRVYPNLSYPYQTLDQD